MHSCARCGRRFARAENLRKHMSKKKPCLEILPSMNRVTECWDPIPDTVPHYDKLECPFCKKTMSSKSNRDRHIRHYCERAKQVFINDYVNTKMKEYKTNVIDYLKSLPPETTVADVIAGQNIITNREHGYRRP